MTPAQIKFITKIENGQEFSLIAYFGYRGRFFETWYPTVCLPYLSGCASFWRVPESDRNINQAVACQREAMRQD